MLGTIIGAAAGIIGNAISAGQARKANEEEKAAREQARKDQEKILKQREERAYATYARRVNQDYTQRADAQRLLQITRNQLKKRAEKATGQQAVLGLTDSGGAAERELAAETMANTASAIAAAGESEKTAAENAYELQQADIDTSRMGLIASRGQDDAAAAAAKARATGQAVGQMVQGVGQAAGALTGAFAATPKLATSKAATPSIPDVSKAMAPRINAPTTEAKNLMQQWDKDIKVSLGKNVPGYHKV